jgi:hypothetical protein
LAEGRRSGSASGFDVGAVVGVVAQVGREQGGGEAAEAGGIALAGAFEAGAPVLEHRVDEAGQRQVGVLGLQGGLDGGAEDEAEGAAGEEAGAVGGVLDGVGEGEQLAVAVVGREEQVRDGDAGEAGRRASR